MRILAFAGSTRIDSFNKKLVRVAATEARAAGADVSSIDLRDYTLPIYDGDLEAAEGPPESAVKLKALFNEHDGLLIASPEYNSSFTPVLKNTIDWVSRPAEGEPPLAAFRGKVAALMSASPGALGGLRGLVHARALLGNIGVVVLPNQVTVSKAHEAFGEDGTFRDAKTLEKVRALARELVDTTRRIHE